MFSYSSENALSENIVLAGPTYVKTGEFFWVRCSLNIVPFDKIIEFYVDDRLYDTVYIDESGCFSSRHISQCFSKICLCSSDGKLVQLNITHSEELGTEQLKIGCSAKFTQSQHYRQSTINVQILGMHFTIVRKYVVVKIFYRK